GFDLYALVEADSDYIPRLLREMAPMFETGTLRPVPYRTTNLERLSEMVHNFRKATHIGKQVVSLKDSIIDMVPGRTHIPLRDEVSYLVSGGLSGFGLSTARWFAECGARHLVLVGRRGVATPEATAALENLREVGVEVHAIACDVANQGQVQSLCSRFGKDFPPLAGIVHAAMVLNDGPARDMTREHIESVLVPKVDGAWNLHLSTQDQDLDFFICYSSIANIVGNREQANYAAANEYLEAFARYRRATGKPALAIGWGAIGAAGFVARDAEIREAFSRQGIFDLDSKQAWSAIAHGLRTDVPYLCAVVVDWQRLKKYSRIVSSSPQFSLLTVNENKTSRDEKSAKSALQINADDTSEDRLENLGKIVVEEISLVLGINARDLDVEQPLPSLGFDSLMAVELSVALEAATGYGFHRMSLLRPDITAADLVSEIADDLFGEDKTVGQERPQKRAKRPFVAEGIQVKDLSDGDVDKLLRQLTIGD
ncbi:MAG: SDR family oxidoreductase, partial [Fimbriimonadaceae bacterium]|nr:SDR family oxidoreductase [Alphaproteobacteria bacterium]